jgi:hypothetical protein
LRPANLQMQWENLDAHVQGKAKSS